MTAYYNEIEPYAAAWLRNLIAGGHIPAGDVDERDIRDVRPDDLRGYTQCHFFAGLGGWAYALRLAGWPDDRPVWTGSCPCQPFSAAGGRSGFADERHLWPHFHWLIEKCRPRVVFGEQVASKDGLQWLDLVQADLEGAGYAFAAADLCAAGVGAPHIRQRLWWVADADSSGWARVGGRDCGQGHGTSQCSEARLLADADSRECGRIADGEGRQRDGQAAGWVQGNGQPSASGEFHLLADTDRQQYDGCRDGRPGGRAEPANCRADGRLADALHPGRTQRRPESGDGSAAGSGGAVGLGDTGTEGLSARQRAALVGEGRRHEGRATEQPGGASGGVGDTDGAREGALGCLPGGARAERSGVPADDRPRPVNGFWRDADWLLCRDGKWRPVEPGTFPLLDGLPASLDRLRAVEAAAWEVIIDYGAACGVDAREVLRMVRQEIHSEAGRQEQSVGVCRQFSSPALLLDFLLCVETARNGAADCCGFKEAGAEVRARILRGMRPHGALGRAPCGRQPVGQSTEQSADALLALSLVLARAAAAYRAEARKAHAASARVGMLRAYGNAIVPQVAAEWIGAYLDVEIFG